MLNKNITTDLKTCGYSKAQYIILQLLKIQIENSASISFEKYPKILHCYKLIISNKFNYKIKCDLNMEKDLEFLFQIMDDINNTIKKKYD